MQESLQAPGGVSPEQMSVLAQVIEDVSRRAGLSRDDALDLRQMVHLKMLETDFAALRRFERRSSLRAYFTVVVQRVLVDSRRRAFGKWRPSAAARKAGATAMALERLTTLHGMSVSEAIETLRCGSGTPSLSDLRRLSEGLAPRSRRRFVSDSCLADMGVFTDPLLESERQAAARRTRRSLARALARLPHEDRVLISMRYWRRHKVSALARVFDQDAKVLYRRYERTLRTLRESLEADGVSEARI